MPAVPELTLYCCVENRGLLSYKTLLMYNSFCVDKSILAVYNTDSRSYIADKFSPQEYGIATTKGSDFSALCEELITGWLADGTIDALIAENGIE